MLIAKILLLCVLGRTQAHLARRQASTEPESLSIDDYTQAQTDAALRGILANSAEFPGVIAASLARDTARAGETGGQNYYYQWTRDAALTAKTLINRYASGDKTLEPFLKDYVENERKLQRLDTLSGNLTTGGLGEPKYYMNSTAFNEPWGRPQRDGPALRAIAIMGFLSLLNDTEYVQNVTQNVVLPDLNYVATHWNSSGFDLWEEQNGTHFFTAMVQSRALQDGAAFLANSSHATGAAGLYTAVDKQLSAVIDSFWNDTANGTFDAQLNGTRPTGADCANLLASLHGSRRYRPSSEKMLASTSALIDEMTGLYDIDSNLKSSAILIGRYPSDVYDGIQSSKGNPWFLCNSAVAEILFLAATEFASNITSPRVTEINHGFMKKVLPSAEINTTLSSSDLSTLVKNLRSYGDAFLAVEQQFVGTNFSMSEQINRTTGLQQGAHDLTWSYAAFESAARARAGQDTYYFARSNASNNTDTSSRSDFSTRSVSTDKFASKDTTPTSSASILGGSLVFSMAATMLSML